MKYTRYWVVGVCWALITVTAVAAQTATPNPNTLLEDCAAMLPPDRPIPSGPDAPSIKILSPASGTVITSDDPKFADVTFTVEITNFDLPNSGTADEGNHWHLWLNHSIWGMYVQPSGFSGLPYGKWRVCVSLGDANHMDFGMPDAIYLIVEKGANVTVQPSSAPTPTSIATATAPASDPSTGTLGTADRVSPTVVIVFLGGLALAAGLWLGGRRK